MLELETALKQVLAALSRGPSEEIPLVDAFGRILARDIHAPMDLPGFDNSCMDGFAVRAADTKGAGPTTPVTLRVIGRLPAGDPAQFSVQPGTCVRLFTGSPMPGSSDAVVMQEDTALASPGGDLVHISAAVDPGENVRFRGEDVRQDSVIGRAGQAVNAAHLSLFAAAGVPKVLAGARPRLALISTGSELQLPGSPLSAGQIYESNRLALAALARSAGAVPSLLPLVPDTLSATRAALETAFDQNDFVATSGGVSVGELDLVKEAFEQIGGKMSFWRVAIKPGKPFVLGKRGEKLLFGLPGNPVSAFVTFLLLVRPALLAWQGATEYQLPARPAVLGEALENRGPRRHFIRVRTESDGRVYSAGKQASHCLSSLGAATGLVDIPPDTTLPEGQPVQVLSW